MQCSLPLCRTFASQTPSEKGDILSKDMFDRTNAMLQQVQVLKLRQELEDAAELKLHIPYSQLLQMAKTSGAANDDKEAREVALALHRAGVLLLHHDTVYLRPEDIAAIVMQVLPGGREDASKKLSAIEIELSELDKQHQQLDKAAKVFTYRFLLAGYAILFIQLVGFVRLTWWELSWDVMEPIAYIISLFYSLVGYTYFLATRGHGVFDLAPFKEFWYTHLKKRKVAQLNFDEGRYQYLLRLRERYKRHLSGQTLSN